MDTLYIWILVGGLCCIVAIGIGWREWEPEGFQVQGLLSRDSTSVLEWVRTPLDHAARAGNSCRVLDRFADPGLAGAVIEVVDDTCESGLPHTVGTDRIRIPEGVWNSPAGRRNHILAHERIHLLQRRSPDLWKALYREWEYTLHSDAPEGYPEEEKGLLRANPDTFPNPWVCWRGRYWFAPLYRSTEAPRLQDARTRVWDAVKGTWLEEMPYEWRIRFCTERGQCPHQDEHPAEIAAEIAADIPTGALTAAAASLRRFLDENFPEVTRSGTA